MSDDRFTFQSATKSGPLKAQVTSNAVRVYTPRDQSYTVHGVDYTVDIKYIRQSDGTLQRDSDYYGQWEFQRTDWLRLPNAKRAPSAAARSMLLRETMYMAKLVADLHPELFKDAYKVEIQHTIEAIDKQIASLEAQILEQRELRAQFMAKLHDN